MDPKLRRALSPVALATVLTIAGLPVIDVPWLSTTPAGANHCTPACDQPACNCACNCDCAGCEMYPEEDQPERCTP